MQADMLLQILSSSIFLKEASFVNLGTARLFLKLLYALQVLSTSQDHVLKTTTKEIEYAKINVQKKARLLWVGVTLRL